MVWGKLVYTTRSKDEEMSYKLEEDIWINRQKWNEQESWVPLEMKHQEVRTHSVCSPDNLNQLKPLSIAEISSRSERLLKIISSL